MSSSSPCEPWTRPPFERRLCRRNRFLRGGLGGGRRGPLRFKIAEGPPDAIRNDPQVIDAYLGGAED